MDNPRRSSTKKGDEELETEDSNRHTFGNRQVTLEDFIPSIFYRKDESSSLKQETVVEWETLYNDHRDLVLHVII